MAFEDTIKLINNSQLRSVGKFSSQTLRQRGTRKTVRSVDTELNNTYKAGQGDTKSAPGDVVLIGNLNLKAGSAKIDTFDIATAYFEGRGYKGTNAITMAMLSVDISKMQGESITSFLEQHSQGKVRFSNTTMFYFNALRSPNNQVANVSDVNNKASPRGRNVRL